MVVWMFRSGGEGLNNVFLEISLRLLDLFMEI